MANALCSFVFGASCSFADVSGWRLQLGIPSRPQDVLPEHCACGAQIRMLSVLACLAQPMCAKKVDNFPSISYVVEHVHISIYIYNTYIHTSYLRRVFFVLGLQDLLPRFCPFKNSQLPASRSRFSRPSARRSPGGALRGRHRKERMRSPSLARLWVKTNGSHFGVGEITTHCCLF